MRSSRYFGSLCLLWIAASTSLAQTPAKRPLNLDDVNRLEEVEDPQCSPDGKWIAYSVSTVDREADKRHSSIWMVSWDGTEDVRLTYDSESETSRAGVPMGDTFPLYPLARVQRRARKSGFSTAAAEKLASSLM